MNTGAMVPGVGGHGTQGSSLANPILHLSAAPPTFTETPPQYIEAKEGSSVTMTCTAFGNPKPIVTWLKEGTLLGASGKYQVSVFSVGAAALLPPCSPFLCLLPLPGGLLLHVTLHSRQPGWCLWLKGDEWSAWLHIPLVHEPGGHLCPET